MFYSDKYSRIVLRLGVAFVFFWFGLNKFFSPDYWQNAWLPDWVVGLLQSIDATGLQFIYLLGIFEILVGLSVITGVFTRLFSSLAVIFLIGIMISFGITGVTVRDICITSALIAIILWPEKKYG